MQVRLLPVCFIQNTGKRLDNGVNESLASGMVAVRED